MIKIEITKELKIILDKANCKNCPLNDICKFLMDNRDSDFDCICNELNNI